MGLLVIVAGGILVAYGATIHAPIILVAAAMYQVGGAILIAIGLAINSIDSLRSELRQKP